MAALTTAQEYQAVREAIQALTTTGKAVVSISIGAMSLQYSAQQLPWLAERERELAARLSARNRRKRVTPDMSY
jgi:hypothetical protein